MVTIRLFTTALNFARWTGCAFVCATVLTLPAWGLNPAYRISQYGHTSWRSDAGVQAVRRIKQTPDGYLWLATRIDLMRFDGVRFSTFKAGGEEGLESSTMQDLLIDPDGSMWVATLGGGVAHYQGGKFHTYAVKDGLPSVDIHSLFRDSHGTVWVGTRGAGIVRMVNRKFEKLSVPIPPSRITALLEDADHSVWIATYGYGVFRLQNETVRSFTIKDGLPDNRIDALCRDHLGRIWTAGIKGISSWNGARFVANAAVNATVSIATSCIEDRDRNLWIGSSSGLLRVRNTEVVRMDRSMGLSSDLVWDIFEDREGNLWVGTRGGLDRLRDEQVHVLAQPGPVVSDGQDVWTASNEQISRVAGNTIQTLPLSLPRGSMVTTLSSRPEAGLLIGSYKGAWIWSGRHIHSVPELSGLSIRSLLQARDGSIWIGSANRGLLRWKPSAGSQKLTETGVPDKSIVALAQDHTGAIWAGSVSGAGLYRLAGGTVQHFGRDEGLRSTVIYSVYVDDDGKLWVGSAGGLSWLQDGHMRTVSSQQGLPSDQVFATLDDPFDRLWFAGYAGIGAIDKKSLSEWASGVRPKIKSVLYPYPQGVEFLATTFGQFFPSAARSADGRLWFGALFGLCEVTPPAPGASHIFQFPVRVEDITIDGIAHSESSRIRVTPGARSIELRYTALTLSNPEAVRFRYRLDGFDGDWINAGTRRLAFYNNLKPGVYNFRVAASTDQEQWQESSTLVLDQLPFFYQTWWFTLLASATILSLVFFVYRLRLRQAVDRIQTGFQQRIDERTRIARDLHDTLLQSFQALLFRLQSVRNVLPDRPGEAVQRLDSAIDQTAQAITEGRDAVLELRPSVVIGNDLVQTISTLGEDLAAHETNNKAARFSVQVEGTPRNLHPIVRDEVYRIAGEAMRNALRHSEAQRIEVEIRFDGRQFRMRVRDDGKGIDPKVLAQNGHPGHFGLRGMGERAKLVGGRLDVLSEPDSGTEIQLTIPAAIAYEKRRDGRRFWLFPRAGSN
jgi:signal transduction histidine kinase/ligand-binding sensor domain-containing protein